MTPEGERPAAPTCRAEAETPAHYPQKPSAMNDNQSNDPTDTLHQLVTRRWTEIVHFALGECADGYNRGYVLLPGREGKPSYIPVPDRKLSPSETSPPYTLEQATLATDNCEEFVVVAIEEDGELIWDTFSEVDGKNIYDAAEDFEDED